MSSPSSPERFHPRDLFDVLIRTGLVVMLSISCYQIFHPFLGLVLWSTILAVTLYPLQLSLSQRLGNRPLHAAALIVLLFLALLLVPIAMAGGSLAEGGQQLAQKVLTDGLKIPLPPEYIAQWPLIGERLFALWHSAATDLSALISSVVPQLKQFIKPALSELAGAGVGLAIFICAVLVAGLIMAYGSTAAHTAQRIATRIAGPQRGVDLAVLCTATIRAVAQGVIGVAFIQAVLLGLGFMVAGVPGAGALMGVALVLGIAQLPLLLVSVPVILYMFTTDMSSIAFITFTAYTLVAGLVDNVLKPLLFGRGVSVPMPVILIGALGGMVHSGIIGLFVGPVTLALGYALFMSWVDMQDATPLAAPTDNETQP